MGAPKRPRRGRGEGSIEELRSGKFRAVVSAGKDAQGRRLKLQQTFATKREALAWRAARLREVAGGACVVGPGKTTCGGWLRSWLAARKQSVEEVTYETYERHVRLHLLPLLDALPLSSLRPHHLTGGAGHRGLYDRLEERGLSDALRRHVAETLGSALAAAVEARLIPSSPYAAAGPPRRGPRPKIRPLSQEECRRLLATVAGDRMEALYALALDAGLRQAELLGLHWPEVDLPARAVRVVQAQSGARSRKLKDTKTALSRRSVLLAPATCRLLAAHRERMRAEGRDVERGVVFVSARGGRWRRASLSRHFARRRRKAGLPSCRFQDLRHTTATLLLRAGVSVKAVSARLGHADAAMTLRVYAHVVPGDDERMAAETGRLLYGEIVPPVSHGGLCDGAGI